MTHSNAGIVEPRAVARGADTHDHILWFPCKINPPLQIIMTNYRMSHLQTAIGFETDKPDDNNENMLIPSHQGLEFSVGG